MKLTELQPNRVFSLKMDEQEAHVLLLALLKKNNLGSFGHTIIEDVIEQLETFKLKPLTPT